MKRTEKTYVEMTSDILQTAMKNSRNGNTYECVVFEVIHEDENKKKDNKNKTSPSVYFHDACKNNDKVVSISSPQVNTSSCLDETVSTSSQEKTPFIILSSIIINNKKQNCDLEAKLPTQTSNSSLARIDNKQCSYCHKNCLPKIFFNK